MTNSVKNRIMRILAVIAIVCVGMVIAFAVKPAKAEQTVAGKTEFAVQADAGVYIGDELSGIAFKTDVAKSYYESLKTDSNTVEFFTIVTAEKKLTGDITSLTVETAEELDAVIIKPAEDISFVEGDTWTYQVAITYEDAELSAEKLEEAYATKLVARSYLKVTDGETETVIYAQNDTKATSIREVAAADLAEAIETGAVLSQENVAKLTQYIGKEDAKAYTDTANQVDFIDQELDGAEVYVINETADGFDSVGMIQNGVLASESLALTGTIGGKTEVLVVNGEDAFWTDVTEVTDILRTKEDFVAMFKGAYDQVDLFENVTADAIVPITGKGNYIDPDNAIFAQVYDGYYVLATNVQFGADETFDINGTSYNEGQVEAYAAANPNWEFANVDWTGCGTRYWKSTSRTFAAGSIFDGLGHYVDGITYAQENSYLFGKAYGTIRNLALTNMDLNLAPSAGLALEPSTKSHIENIYVQVVNAGSYRKQTPGNRSAGLFQKWNYGHLENVVVEYPNVNDSYQCASFYGTGYIDYLGYDTATDQNVNTSSKNVLAITETLVAGSYSTSRVNLASNDTDVTEVNGKTLPTAAYFADNGVRRYDNYDALKNANIDLSAFDNGIWDISSGAPVWASLINAEVTVNGEEASEAIFTAEGGESTATFDITSDAMDIDFDAYVVDESIATYADGVISKVDKAFGETELIYSYVVAGKTYTGSIRIIVERVRENLGTDVFSAYEGTLPTSITEQLTSEVTGVYYRTDLENNLYADGKVAIENNTNDMIETDVVIATADDEYLATLLVYTRVIYSADDFKDVFWTPTYHITQTHSITYKGTTYTETFNDIDNPEMLYKNGTNVYMNLSEDFIAKLADGATRNADDTVITAEDLTGAYLLGADIEALGTNKVTYGYQFSAKTVTASNAKNPVTASDSVVWGSNTYDKAGYKLAGVNAYLYLQTFNGLLDGNGHTIDGFVSDTQGGLLGTIGVATIKNFAITNVTSGTAGASTGILSYQVNSSETLVENIYIEIDTVPNSPRFGAIAYTNHSSQNGAYTIKDVVIVMPTMEWSYTTTFGAGIIASSTGANAASQPVTENVVAITGTDIVAGYGHASSVATRRVWVAENDADLVADGGKYNSTIIGGKKVVQTGLFRYADLASAIAAEKTAVGNWTITAEGVVWTDATVASYSLSKKA